MSSPWKVKIHRLVLSEDFRRISHSGQRIILKDIQKKLSLSPQDYGKPLQGELKGFWRLRVGDYRVIYKINHNVVEVSVVKVGMRRDAEIYKDFISLLKRHSF